MLDHSVWKSETRKSLDLERKLEIESEREKVVRMK